MGVRPLVTTEMPRLGAPGTWARMIRRRGVSPLLPRTSSLSRDGKGNRRPSAATVMGLEQVRWSSAERPSYV